MTKISSEDALLEAALLSPEIAPFAMFNLDLGAMVHPDSGEPVFPELGGVYTPLWEIRSHSNQAHDLAHTKEKQRSAARTHLARVELMTKRVAAGLPLHEDDDTSPPTPAKKVEVSPTDEWAHFWGGASPTQKLQGYVP